MPRVTEGAALAFAESVRKGFSDDSQDYDIEDVVREVLTHTACYYASNPLEVETWITESMTREAEAAECEDYRKPLSVSQIAKQERQRVMDESEKQRGVRT